VCVFHVAHHVRIFPGDLVIETEGVVVHYDRYPLSDLPGLLRYSLANGRDVLEEIAPRFANTMFLFTGVVLTLIAVATVQHTIAANVSDRLKEIGMLRSLGFPRAAVTAMFVRESVLLASAGAVLALAVTRAEGAEQLHHPAHEARREDTDAAEVEQIDPGRRAGGFGCRCRAAQRQTADNGLHL